MLTQCPECETAFRINTAILRAAGGQVRCGKCRTQFDALDRLLDDEGTPLTRIDQATLSDEDVEARSQILVDEPPAQEEITLEGKRIEVTGTFRAIDEGATGVPEDIVQQHYVIESDVPDELEPEPDHVPAFMNTSQVRARRIEEEDEAMLRAAEAGIDVAPKGAATADPEEATVGSRDRREEDIDLLAPAKPQRPRSWIWKATVIPLALLLIVQYVHHERADLARHPTIGPPLISTYNALGLTINPNWNVRAYDLKQRGVIADPAVPGTLTVRASITNLAEYPQPFPLLKLVLEDRFGNAVRARAFKPQEYAVIADAEALMSPGQRAEARLAIADPGREAEGFRFDLCLPRAEGVICAEEAPQATE